jgi:hypothetical protein
LFQKRIYSIFLGTFIGKRKQTIFKKRWFDITNYSTYVFPPHYSSDIYCTVGLQTFLLPVSFSSLFINLADYMLFPVNLTMQRFTTEKQKENKRNVEGLVARSQLVIRTPRPLSPSLLTPCTTPPPLKLQEIPPIPAHPSTPRPCAKEWAQDLSSIWEYLCSTLLPGGGSSPPPTPHYHGSCLLC